MLYGESIWQKEQRLKQIVKFKENFDYLYDEFQLIETNEELRIRIKEFYFHAIHLQRRKKEQ